MVGLRCLDVVLWHGRNAAATQTKQHMMQEAGCRAKASRPGRHAAGWEQRRAGLSHVPGSAGDASQVVSGGRQDASDVGAVAILVCRQHGMAASGDADKASCNWSSATPATAGQQQGGAVPRCAEGAPCLQGCIWAGPPPPTCDVEVLRGSGCRHGICLDFRVAHGLLCPAPHTAAAGAQPRHPAQERPARAGCCLPTQPTQLGRQCSNQPACTHRFHPATMFPLRSTCLALAPVSMMHTPAWQWCAADSHSQLHGWEGGQHAAGQRNEVPSGPRPSPAPC